MLPEVAVPSALEYHQVRRQEQAPWKSDRQRAWSSGWTRTNAARRFSTDEAGFAALMTADETIVERGLRILVDRRRSIGEEHTYKVNQLHALLLELIPGGAKRDLSAAQARKLLAVVRPRDVVGKTCERVAAELVADLERLYARKKAANKELTALLRGTGTTLTALHGIGPSGAARLLVEVGDINRFPDKGHFASWTGTAPIDASSGDNVRHRLSRGGNRKINRVLHIMAVVQLRNPSEGRAYYDRKVAAGKTPNEAMRCLKRRRSDLVYRALLDDLSQGAATGPGGHSGNGSDSSATGSQPDTGSSDKSLPGPATTKTTTGIPKAS